MVLISSVQSQSLGGARELALIIPCLTNGLLVFGLTQLTHFNPQERIWREAIDRAKVLAIVNVGLSPFLYFWARLPEVPLYAIAVDLLYLSSLLFLYNFNLVIYRLTTMLPDESLRGDAQPGKSKNWSSMAFSTVSSGINSQQRSAPKPERQVQRLLSPFEDSVRLFQGFFRSNIVPNPGNSPSIHWLPWV